MRRTLVVIANASISDQVKNHLSPPLDSGTAATLYECFVTDIVRKAAAVPDAELVIACTPHGTRPIFQDLARDASQFILDKEEDLGERMLHCFERLYQPGRAVVIIGTDCPTLPARSLELAFDVLASGQVDVVFGPASNGGYYLVGMTSPHPEPFRGVKWDASELPDKNIERATKLGLGWYLLPEWYNVDQPADLARLKKELLEQPADSSAPHTKEYLLHLAKLGFI